MVSEAKAPKSLLPLLRKAKDIKKTSLVYRSGSIALDLSSRVGGFLRFQLNRLGGVEGTGKSSMCYTIAKQAISEGQRVLWVDYEMSFVPDRFTEEEKDFVDVIRFEKDAKMRWTLENVFTAFYQYMRANAETGGIIVLDSVDAAISNKRADSDAGSALYAERAKVLSSELPIFISDLITYGFTAFFISQARDDMDSQFPGQIKFSGGRQMKHSARQFISLKKAGKYKKPGIGDDGKPAEVDVGDYIKARWERLNDDGLGYLSSCTFPIRSGVGIDRINEIINFGAQLDIIKKAGSWYSYGDFKVQGEEGFTEWLKEHPSETEAIVEEIYRLGLTP